MHSVMKKNGEFWIAVQGYRDPATCRALAFPCQNPHRWDLWLEWLQSLKPVMGL